MNFYRLSSFLSKEGKLDVYRLSTINPNVFYLRTDSDESFILKKHRSRNRVQQQWDFFEEKPSTVVVPFHSFPNGRKYLYTGGNYWTISPYKAGSKLNYKVERDRMTAVKTLKQFHREASGVKIPYPLKKEKFYLRWYNRLESFKKTEEIFEKFGYETLYMDIVQTTDRALRFISRFPWERIEKEGEYHGKWIHGDVASHNFIRGKDKIFLMV